jgi:tetratricopeptide (TPR) repeat protein
VLQYEPGNVDATRNLAVLLRANGNITEALSLYQYGEAQQFNDADFYVNYANLLIQLGHWGPALEQVDKAIGFNAKNIKALFVGAECCEKLGLLDKALELLGLAQAQEWSLATQIKVISLLLSLGQLDEALSKVEILMAQYSNVCEVQILAAQVYQTADQHQKAEQAYEMAFVINPSHPDLYFNRAILWAKMGNIEGAIADSRKAIAILPQNPEYHFQLATFLLTAGQYQEGWKEYEWRTHPQRTELQRVIEPSFAGIPKWSGEPLKDHSILIVPEQGFGDQIQFIRYAKWLKELGAIVLVGAQKPLVQLLESCPWVDKVVADGESFAADFWIFSMSLPQMANTSLDTIPADVPYLFAAPEKVEQWRCWLNSKGISGSKPLIGVCWQGDGKHVQNAKRSIPIDLLSDLVNVAECEFVGITRERDALSSYQLGNKELHNAGPELVNFSDTAGLLEHVDLLISVDSAPAHLAGAMNKPCWVLLDTFVDFRWLQDASTSPWYPSIKLYRKTLGEGWGGKLEQVKNDLSSIVGKS